MSDDYGSPIYPCGPVDYEKDPDDTIDYVFNFAPELGEDTLGTVELLTPDGGLTVNSMSFDEHTVTVWLTGGSRGLVYRLTLRYTSAAGRRRDKTIRILIREQ